VTELAARDYAGFLIDLKTRIRRSQEQTSVMEQTGGLSLEAGVSGHHC